MGILSYPSSSGRQVRDLVDLNHHIEAHLERVIALGMWIGREHFSDLDPNLVREFLSLHDQSKLNSTDEFSRRYGIDRKRHPFFMIAELWGKNDVMKNGTPQERELIPLLRDKLNQVDLAVAMDFFKKHGLLAPDGKPGPIAELLLRIESIADKVDRGKAPIGVEEFNRPITSSVGWLKDPADQAIGREAEAVYEKVTQGKDFATYNARRYSQVLRRDLEVHSFENPGRPPYRAPAEIEANHCTRAFEALMKNPL